MATARESYGVFLVDRRRHGSNRSLPYSLIACKPPGAQSEAFVNAGPQAGNHT